MSIDVSNIWAGPQRSAGKPPPWLAPNFGSQPPAQQPPEQSGNNFANIQTGINPTAPYTQQMTNAAVNNAFAANTPDLNYAMKAFDRPGVSRSAGTAGAAIGSLGQLAGNQMQAQAQIPFGDYFANQQSMLGGETAREGAALDQYGLMNQLTGANNQLALGNRTNQIGDVQQFLSLYQYLMGGA